MAITVNHLTTSNSLANQATAYSTASITPGANRLVLLLTSNHRSSGGSIRPIVSGNSLTWEIVTEVLFDSFGGDTMLSLFRAMGASPSTGAISIDPDGYTASNCFWSVVEFNGVDTSGANGSGAIVQSQTNLNNVGVSSLTVTLGAFSSADNATYGGFKTSFVTAGINEGGGFTEFAESQGSGTGSDAGCIQSEYLLGNDTTVDASSASGTPRWGGIAVEVKSAAVASVPWGRPQQFSQLLAQ